MNQEQHLPHIRSRRSTSQIRAVLLAAAFVWAGCRTGVADRPPGDAAAAGAGAPPRTYEGLNSVLWMQTSEEYRGSALQAYRTATMMLDQALLDRRWTAALEQDQPSGDLPPAVILDVDETVLDNSPFQARLNRSGGTFNDANWGAWVMEASAKPVPGALQFTRYAAERGVMVFYITNRSQRQEEATRANLRRREFPLSEKIDTLLTLGEGGGEGLDKTERRRSVAARYRILLLVGDDLGDFASGVHASVEARRALTAPHEDRWGTKWIIVSNPMYGSWEKALLRSDPPLTPAQQLQRRLERLDIGENP